MPTHDGRLFYRVPEAATLLGISPAHLYRQCQENLFDHVRVGRRVLIPVEAVRRLTKGVR